MKTTLHKTIFVLALSGLAAGCGTVVPLQPGAENVTLGTQPVTGCTYVGKVASMDVNGWDGYTSHKHLQTNEITSLKNSAILLNANYVLLTDHTISYSKHAGGSINLVDEHRMAGDAYRCSTRALNNLPELNPDSLHDAPNN